METKVEKDLQKTVSELKETIRRYEQSNRRKNIVIPTSGDTVRFACFSDPHYGSLYERVSDLNAFCQRAEKEEYNPILCAGDVLDGWRVYKGQEFGQHKRGFKEQSKHFEQVAPKLSYAEINFITGNHDESFSKLIGMDVGQELSAKKPDWKYVGNCYGEVTLTTRSKRDFVIALMHPGGGTAYAVSYKTQKIIEQWEGGRKPNMIVLGHFHKSELLPMYRNVIGVQAGCFQSQTPFMARLPSAAHVGGWFFEVKLGKGCNRIKSEFVAFY